jgi:hypothetical protein
MFRPSPRRFRNENTPPFESSRIDSMISKMGQVLSHVEPVQSIADIETYIFVKGLVGLEAEAARAKYPPPPVVPVVEVKKNKMPSDHEYVKVNIRVSSNGKVYVSIMCPMEAIQPYYKKGHMPPFELRVVAAQKFGHSDFTLKRMISRHDEWRKNSKKLDLFIESIFGVAKK